MQEMQVQSLGWEDPLEEEMATTPVFLPQKSNGQRSLAGYSSWGHKELDTTEAAEHTLTEGEKRPVSPLEDSQEKYSFSYSDFLAYSGLQLTGWGPWTLGKAICFTQSTDSDVHLIQKQSHRYTRIKFDQLSVHPMAQSGWSIKLTITMSACVARHVQILLVRTCCIYTSWL